jgi:hypothetical protein
MAEGLGRSIQAAIEGNRLKGLPLHGILLPSRTVNLWMIRS